MVVSSEIHQASCQAKSFTGSAQQLAGAGAEHHAEEAEASDKNLPTVGLVALAEQESVLVEDHKTVVQELAEAAIHTIDAQLEGARGVEADPEDASHTMAVRLEAASHTTAARLEVVIHTMAVQLGVARGAEADLEAANHMIAAVVAVRGAAGEDLEAAIHVIVVQQLVEGARRAEAEAVPRIRSGVEAAAVHRIRSGVEAAAEHRIRSGVEAVAVHRIHAVAEGPADQAAVDHECPFHRVPEEEELRMVRILQGC
jgi:hypothetical protein